MFEQSREPCAPCLRSSGVANPALLVYVRAKSRTFLTPCLRSSGVENPALLVYVRAESRTLPYLFTFERSREPCSTCSCSSGVENPALLDTMFMFERSREPFSLGKRSRELCSTLLPVYVRAESRTLRYFTPCLCWSGVENLALLYSLFMFERSREPFY
jgi:hypothetical protein